MEQSHHRFWYSSPSIQNSHFPLIFIFFTATLNEKGERIIKYNRFIYEGGSVIFIWGGRVKML